MTGDSYPHFDLSDAAARVFCRGCGAAYLREVGECSTCGSKEFVTREEARELESQREVRPPQPLPGGGVELVVTRWIVEEDEVRLALEEAGIPYRTAAGPAGFDGMRSASPDLSFFVAEEDLERANRVLDGMEERAPATDAGDAWHEDWRAQGAGEEGRFSAGAVAEDAGADAAAPSNDALSTDALAEGTIEDDNPYGIEEWPPGGSGSGGLSKRGFWSSRAARLGFLVISLALFLAYCAK